MKKSFDGDTSTMWTANRENSPYVAYEVFYAGDGMVFNLDKMSMQGDGSTKLMYLGTDKDDILKTHSELGSTATDLAKRGNELYRPFAQLYSADILGIAEGANVSTALSGKYRYLIVAATTWSKTNIKELTLSAAVEKIDGSEVKLDINRTDGKVYADATVKYNNSGKQLILYIAGYDENGVLKSIEQKAISNYYTSVDLVDDSKSYKAFVWTENQIPISAQALIGTKNQPCDTMPLFTSFRGLPTFKWSPTIHCAYS